jgi:hypothetical protein
MAPSSHDPDRDPVELLSVHRNAHAAAQYVSEVLAPNSTVVQLSADRRTITVYDADPREPIQTWHIRPASGNVIALSCCDDPTPALHRISASWPSRHELYCAACNLTLAILELSEPDSPDSDTEEPEGPRGIAAVRQAAIEASVIASHLRRDRVTVEAFNAGAGDAEVAREDGYRDGLIAALAILAGGDLEDAVARMHEEIHEAAIAHEEATAVAL